MKLQVRTQRSRQVIDITDQLDALIPEHVSGVAVLTVLHTTAAVTTADLDPGTDQDLLDFLDLITPNRPWRHPHDPQHVPDHLLASIIGPSVTLPIEQGRLLLGAWQRVVLVELAGPRPRQLSLTILQA
ncbi:MAG TPA: secondary thiamine-phosphate synthase enzyme YjbQ [Candidatus Saccharimonadia bacterium]